MYLLVPDDMLKSPSARKVWIEMIIYIDKLRKIFCRLPQGRCGLKFVHPAASAFSLTVAFRKEGVD